MGRRFLQHADRPGRLPVFDRLNQMDMMEELQDRQDEQDRMFGRRMRRQRRPRRTDGPEEGVQDFYSNRPGRDRFGGPNLAARAMRGEFIRRHGDDAVTAMDEALAHIGGLIDGPHLAGYLKRHMGRSGTPPEVGWENMNRGMDRGMKMMNSAYGPPEQEDSMLGEKKRQLRHSRQDAHLNEMTAQGEAEKDRELERERIGAANQRTQTTADARDRSATRSKWEQQRNRSMKKIVSAIAAEHTGGGGYTAINTQKKSDLEDLLLYHVENGTLEQYAKQQKISIAPHFLQSLGQLNQRPATQKALPAGGQPAGETVDEVFVAKNGTVRNEKISRKDYLDKIKMAYISKNGKGLTEEMLAKIEASPIEMLVAFYKKLTL